MIPEAQAKFFFKSKSTVVLLEMCIISHPSFTQDYYIVRNDSNGVVVTLPNGNVQQFEYFPLQISDSGFSNDLDRVFTVEIGDGKILATKEIQRVIASGNMLINPTLTYLLYRDDDLTKPILPAVVLYCENFRFKSTCTFDAKTKGLNTNKTGLYYTLDNFPMLRGFL